MSDLSEAVTMVKDLSTGGDPVLEATKWVVLILIVIASASVPLMMLRSKSTRDKNETTLETAISDVGSALYTQLGKQVEDYRLAADAANKERNDLVMKVAKLEAQLLSLEPAKELVERLRGKLDVKDAEIRNLLDQGLFERKQFMDMVSAKDKDISRRDDRIAQLERVTTALQVNAARSQAFTELTSDPHNTKSPSEAAALVNNLIPQVGRRVTDDTQESPI